MKTVRRGRANQYRDYYYAYKIRFVTYPLVIEEGAGR